MKAGIFEVKTIRCHPTDYIWILLGHDPMWAHQVVVEWMEWKIETMAQAAIDRINEPTPTEKADAGRVYLDDFEINGNSYAFLREVTPWDRVVINPVLDPVQLKAQIALESMTIKPPGPIVIADELFPDQGPQVTTEQQLSWIQKVLEKSKLNPFGAHRG
jgi:hypothetical protein